jgi:hypothetical protein
MGLSPADEGDRTRHRAAVDEAARPTRSPSARALQKVSTKPRPGKGHACRAAIAQAARQLDAVRNADAQRERALGLPGAADDASYPEAEPARAARFVGIADARRLRCSDRASAVRFGASAVATTSR